jgi:hypothetical protein
MIGLELISSMALKLRWLKPYAGSKLQSSFKKVASYIPLSIKQESRAVRYMVRAKITNLANGRTQFPQRKAGKNKNNYLLKPRYRCYNGIWYQIRQRLDPQIDNCMKWNPVLDTDIRIWKDGKPLDKIPLEESIHHTPMKSDRTYEWEYLGIKIKFALEWQSGGVITFDAILAPARTSSTDDMMPFTAPETIDIENTNNNKQTKKSNTTNQQAYRM